MDVCANLVSQQLYCAALVLRQIRDFHYHGNKNLHAILSDAISILADYATLAIIGQDFVLNRRKICEKPYRPILVFYYSRDRANEIVLIDLFNSIVKVINLDKVDEIDVKIKEIAKGWLRDNKIEVLKISDDSASVAIVFVLV